MNTPSSHLISSHLIFANLVRYLEIVFHQPSSHEYEHALKPPISSHLVCELN